MPATNGGVTPAAMDRRGVRVAGTSLASALGLGTAASVARLLAHDVPAPVRWRPDDLDAEFVLHAMADGGTHGSLARSLALVASVMDDACTQAGLDAATRAAMPLFIGTSSFSLGRDASELDVSRVAAARAPVLAHGQLGEVVQRASGSAAAPTTVQTACTSSAVALVAAMRAIATGRSTHALVVGVELASAVTLAGFAGLQLLTDALRPFDRARSGIVLGESVSAVVLAAAEASAPGLHLRDGGTNVDPFSVTTPDPEGRAAIALQASVLARAGVPAAMIRGIKAHGTGSAANDVAESAVIRALGDHRPPVCALKGWIGHTLGACGTSELALLAGALERGVIPATPGFTDTDDALGIVPTRTSHEATPGHWLLNFFGFGGHNAVLLAEHVA